MKTVAVVDYGMGNLRSVSQAVRHVAALAPDAGFTVVVTSNPDEVLAAERVVLPGQGAMADCMRELRDSGLQAAVLDAAARKPLMGVCVGMQMLLDRSEEGPDGTGTPGLGLIGGDVVRFRLEGRLQPDGSRYKVPQMGWNRVYQMPQRRRRGAPDLGGRPRRGVLLLRAQLLRAPDRPAHSAGETEYGARFTCALARDNIFATQFHPEKSADHGLALYRNFLHWNP